MRVVRNSSLEERRHCTPFVNLKIIEDLLKNKTQTKNKLK